MKKILKKIKQILLRIPLIIKSLKKVYKYGGFSTINIATINYGNILTNKKVLITGGSTGIGFHLAKKCISEGATVVITGRNQDKLDDALLKINNSRLKAIAWDISDIKQIEKYIIETEKLLGGNIDILVNNAGVLLKGQNFPDIKEEVWDKTYAINSKGLFFLTQAIAKKWMANKTYQTKKIINISSQGGFVGATYPYRMTKWDIAGLTQGLAIKLAPYGIIVNGIAPGIIATKMQPNVLNQNNNAYSVHNPVERHALPEEIAELAIYLISDASNFVVGQTIVCDGGFSIK